MAKRQRDATATAALNVSAQKLQGLCDDTGESAELYESKGLRAVLERLATILKSLKPRTVSANEHDATLPSLPLRRFAGVAVSKLSFEPPSNVTVMGSFAAQCIVKPNCVIDIGLEMPVSMFRDHDVKKYAYADKRALFLGVIALELQSLGLFRSVHVEAWGNDTTRPVLLLHVAAAGAAGLLQTAPPAQVSKRLVKLLTEYRFRLIPLLCGGSANAAPSSPPAQTPDAVVGSLFAASTLTPDWNNVRTSVYTNGSAAPEQPDSAAAAELQPPTPHYNAAIAGDIAAAAAGEAVAAALASCPNSRHALIALKALIRRRGWSRCSDGLGGFQAAALVGALVTTGRILPGMSGVQALRATLQFVVEGGLGAGATTPPLVLAVVLSSGSGEGRTSGAAARRATAAAAAREGSGGSDEDDEEEEGSGGGDGDDDDDDEEDDGSAASPPPSSSSSTAPALSPAALQQHRKHAQVLLLAHVVSHTGRSVLLHNITASVSGAVLSELQEDARAALRALVAAPGGTPSSSAPAAGPSVEFEAVFGRAVPPAARYDRLVALPLPPCPLIVAAPAPGAPDAAKQNRAGGGRGSFPGAQVPPPAVVALPRRLPPTASAAAPTPGAPDPLGPRALAPLFCDLPCWAAVASSLLSSALVLGLGDRVLGAVRVMPVFPVPQGAVDEPAGTRASCQTWAAPEPLVWRLGSRPPCPTTLWVGVSLHPSNSSRIVDRGPPPEQAKAAAAFTALWGHGFTELRRFADASIVHAVVWDAPKLGGRPHARDAIVPLIIAHLAHRHIGADTPRAVLHAGDRVSVRGSGGSGGDPATLLLLARADVAVAAPSLALERVLDPGGCVTTEVSITPDAAGGAGAPRVVSEAPARARKHGLALRGADPLARGPSGAFGAALAALDTVSAALRSAPGLPLKISTLTPISPQLRHTAAYPPTPHPLAAAATGAAAAVAGPEEPGAGAGTPLLTADDLILAAALADGPSNGPSAAQAVQPMDLIAELETSTKWPLDDPAALDALKTAFYLKLKYGISAAHRGRIIARAHRDHLLLLAGGFAFRVFLHRTQELVPLERRAGRAPLCGVPGPGGREVGLAALTLELDEGGSRRRGGGGGEAAWGEEGDEWRDPPFDDGADGGGEMEVGSLGNAAGGRERSSGPGPKGPTTPAAPMVRGFINVGPLRATTEPEEPLAAGAKRARGPLPPRSVRNAPLGAIPGLAVLRERLGRGGAAPEGEQGALEAGAALDALFLRGIGAPRHSAAVAAFAQRHAAYAPTVRLAALWLESTGIGGQASASSGCGTTTEAGLPRAPGSSAPEATYFRHELVELLVAHVFSVDPHSRAPASPTAALLRFFQLLGDTDWGAAPLLVSLQVSQGEEGEGGAAAAAGTPPALATRFRAARGGAGSGGHSSSLSGNGGLYPRITLGTRALPPGPPLYVLTAAEAANGWVPLWSSASSPSWAVVNRVTAAARAAGAQLLLALAPVFPQAQLPSAAPRPGSSRLGHVFHSGGVLVRGAAAVTAAPLPPSPLAIMGPALQLPHAPGGSSSSNSPLVLNALLMLKRPMLSRGSTDRRAFGPEKSPIPLALAVCALHHSSPPPVAPPAAAGAGAPGPGDGGSKAVVTPAAGAPLTLVAAAHASKLEQALLHGGKKAALSSPGGGGPPSTLLLSGSSGTAAAASKLTLPLIKNLLPSSRAATLTGFDPLDLLLASLRREYGDHALFFPVSYCEGEGGPGGSLSADGGAVNAVGVTWKQGAFFSHGAAGGEAQALSLLPALARLGSGLVAGVTYCGDPDEDGKGAVSAE